MQRCEITVPAVPAWPRQWRTLALAVLAALSLAGCATLPQAGPTGRRIISAGAKGDFAVVEVTGVSALPQAETLPRFTALPPSWRTSVGQLAPGDTVSVIFYEVGVRIFSGGSSGQGGAFDPAAKGEKVGPIEIDQGGRITLPYVGTLAAAGRTPAQLARDIEEQLRGKSEYPQAVVQLDAANGSAVIVGGEVANPGRVRLTAAHERLLDIIALSGGHRGETGDLLLRVMRGDAVSEGPVDALSFNNIGGMPMEPGDRIDVVRTRRGFSVLGSANKVNRYPLPLRSTSLAEGLALAGGANENVANPAAVFVFRYVRPSPDAPEQPVVYHINMLKPVSYLLAQKFDLQNKDVVYIAGAEANQPGKLLQMIGQVFTPLVIARQITN
ncbi:polysaccharide biosynthesis/export family protein [Novosphingobium sp.]|uniref:polysaccharide biosynthesis/export family protein n=1 Tax=Novosphingobium sp. TaxID=1874826 RepID=UPI001D49F157|nr:polysaccharide biosynthesis/export family protein [Novosphingobium sp.]MBX9663914.1 polysaccharide biosynthesis/export family protein [Novosphingobium sp.]